MGIGRASASAEDAHVRMQFRADPLGMDVVRPMVAETTALGAAYAAGLAVGYWKDRAELERNWGIAARWSPVMPAAERERLYRSWQRAVERSFGWTGVRA